MVELTSIFTLWGGEVTEACLITWPLIKHGPIKVMSS